MARSTFVYVIFIRATTEGLWEALTSPDFIRLYWFGTRCESDFRKGSSWQLSSANGKLTDTGEILEAVPPRRLAIRWRNEFMPELTAEGWSQCVFEIEPREGSAAVKLTVTHGIDREDSKLVKAVADGWPPILSNLKSLLETGEVLMKSHPSA